MIKAKIENANKDEALMDIVYNGRIADIEDELIMLIEEITLSIERKTGISKDKVLTRILGKLATIINFED